MSASMYARGSNGDETTVRVTISGPPRALNASEQLELERLERQLRIETERERQLRIETEERERKEPEDAPR